MEFASEFSKVSKKNLTTSTLLLLTLAGVMTVNATSQSMHSSENTLNMGRDEIKNRGD